MSNSFRLVGQLTGPGRGAVPAGRGLRCLLAAVASLSMLPRADAGIVGTGTPASCNQAALDTQIQAGGTVTFSCGGAVSIPVANLIVAPTNPVTIVDGGGAVTLSGAAASLPMVVLNSSAASLPDVTFRNLTFANGDSLGPAYNGGGGAIYNQGKLTLDTVTFTANHAANPGGAIYQVQCAGCLVPSATIRYSQFNSNQAVGNGGAIHVQDGDLTINDTDFTSNVSTTGDGGAIWLGSSAGPARTLTVSNGHFHLNSSSGNAGGGAISAVTGGKATISVDSSTFQQNGCSGLTSSGGAIHTDSTALTVSGSLFVTNAASSNSSWGGAIAALNGTVSIADSTFRQNEAGNSSPSSSGSGGVGFVGVTGTIRRSTFDRNVAWGNNTAGALGSNGPVSVENSTFSGNSVSGASGYGGAMYVQAGTLDLRNVTVTANAANSSGAIFVAGSGTLRLRNSIVAGNTATGAGGGNSQIGVGGVFASDGHNLIGDATGLVLNNDVVNANPNLGALANNGGPTFGNVVVVGPAFTRLPNAGSPALDAGDPAGCLAIGGGALTTDQRNAARPSPAGGRCDIGAVEVQVAGPASKLAFVQQPTNAVAGAAISPSLTVQLQDAGNAPVAQAGVSVTLTLASGTGALSGTATQTTNASGLATFGGLSVNLAGTKTLSAASAGLSGATSGAFVITAGAAASLTISGGSPQSAQVGTAFGSPLQVLLTDGLGNPVSGAPVSFTAPGSGASAALATSPATTDAAGHAQVTATANATTGNYTVTAASGTLPAVGFNLTNAAAPAAANNVPALGGWGLAAFALALSLLGASLSRRVG